MADALPQGLAAPVSRVAAFLVGLGHPVEPSVAMAANLLNESLAHPLNRIQRRHRSLSVTPDERERLADALLARRALLEGAALSLDGGEVREGAVASAHALCEAASAHRPIRLSIGGRVAHEDQVAAARARLQAELDSTEAILEATKTPAKSEGEEVLRMGVGGGKPHPRVVHLQNRLNMLGHRVAADGKFGEVTREAVKDFQARAGIHPSGEVDDETTLALRHGRRVVEVGPAAVMAPKPEDKLKDVGDGNPNREVGNTASQTGVQGTQPGEKATPLSKRVESIARLLKGLEGLQEADPTSARAQRITRVRAELAEAEMEEAKLSMAERKALPKSDFVFPEKAPESGSYPIHDEGHARAALMMSKGKAAHAAVVAAVKRRYPNIKVEESVAAIISCPKCGAPARKGGRTCQRGHRMAAAPTVHHPWGPVEESRAGVHYASGSAGLGQAERDELKSGAAAKPQIAEAWNEEKAAESRRLHRFTSGDNIFAAREDNRFRGKFDIDKLRQMTPRHIDVNPRDAGEAASFWTPGAAMSSATVQARGDHAWEVVSGDDMPLSDEFDKPEDAVNFALKHADKYRSRYSEGVHRKVGGPIIGPREGHRELHIRPDHTAGEETREAMHLEIHMKDGRTHHHLVHEEGAGKRLKRRIEKQDDVKKVLLREGLPPIEESKQTAALSVTHAPIGKGGKNWVTKTAPGNTGQLPAYIQNIRNAIMRGGKSESEATAIAVGRVQDWASGQGGVHPEVKAAAAKAVAEWEALRGKSKAEKGAKKVSEAKVESPDVDKIDPDELEKRLASLKEQGDEADGVEVARANQEAAMLVATGKVKPGRFAKLQEADTPADFPEYLACPTCHVKTLPSYETCPRGHRLDDAKVLRQALIESWNFNRDVGLLLSECAEVLEETWEDYNHQKGHMPWGKGMKEGPFQKGHKFITSPGRGPTGKLRNFDSMSGPKLAATLQALAVHGEDHEAHQAAMHAAGKKLGMKIHIPQRMAPKDDLHHGKPHGLLDVSECATCGARVRPGGRVCQRGHRLVGVG